MTRFNLHARHAFTIAITAALLLSTLFVSAATRHWRGQSWEYLMFGLAIGNEGITLIPAPGDVIDNAEENAYIEALLLGDAELPQYLAALGDRGWELVESVRIPADPGSIFANLLIFTFKRPET